jgi:hypothetical protein
MYFFFHLFAGLIIGLLISGLLDDRRWLLPCAVGAVLPDLIDKPLGHLLFPATIGYGRIYSHTLLVALLILALGLAIWRMKRDPGVISLGIGILSHQVLDVMWLQPVNWYYPLQGPFQHAGITEEFFHMVLRDLNDPFERVIGILLVVAALAFIYRDILGSSIGDHRQFFSRAAVAAAVLLCCLSGLMIGRGILHQKFSEIGWNSSEELVLGGIILALTAGLVWHYRHMLNNR